MRTQHHDPHCPKEKEKTEENQVRLKQRQGVRKFYELVIPDNIEDMKIRQDWDSSSSIVRHRHMVSQSIRSPAT